MNYAANNIFRLLITVLFTLVITGCAKKFDSDDLVKFIRNGDLKSAQKCVDSGVNINGYSQEGWQGEKREVETPLYAAIWSRSLVAVRWTITNGADVNQFSYGKSCPPIVVAAIVGDIEIVRELEKSGVRYDVTYLDKKPSYWADHSKNSQEFIQYIRDREGF